MISHPKEKMYSKVVNALIFIFPIVIISLQVAGDIVLLILAIMGIYVVIAQRLSPFTIKETRVFSYLTISYFIAVCLSVLFSGQVAELLHYIPRDFYFFFAPFIALSIYKVEVNLKFFLVGAKVSLIVLGVILLYQILTGYGPRPSGVMNPNVFGNLSVSIFFVVLVFSQYESFKNKIFSLLSLSSGLFIIVASGSRGAWASFLLLLPVYLYFFYRQKNQFSKTLKIIMILLMSSLIISIGALNQKVHDRAYLSYSEILSWKLGDETATSSGQRMGMYKKAIDNIEDVPFFGYGLRTANITLFKNDMSEIGRQSVGFNHLHNAYLTSYFNGGFVLLGALLLLLFVPFRIFIKANSQNRENPIFISGAILTLGYMSYGMVNILFGDTYMNGFYVFFLAIFLILTNKSVEVSEV